MNRCTCVCAVCECVCKLEKVQRVPVRAGTGGLWCREVWMAGTAGCLQCPGVWPRTRCCRFMVLNKHLHAGCQDPSQRLIKTFHWNPCEVADPPTLRQQPAAYLYTPQRHTLCVSIQCLCGLFMLRHGITHSDICIFQLQTAHIQ